MARNPLAAQPVNAAGATVVFAAATASDSIVPANGRVLLVQNTTAAAVTVTIPSNTTLDGLVVPDRTIDVPAGSIVAIAVGQFPEVGLEADRTVWINYSATAGVNVAYLAS